MKAKKLMGMIAFASACVSLSAFANTTNGWFGVTVAGGTVTPVNISKNDVGNVKDGAINLTEIDRDSALVFTPDARFSETNRNDGIYVIGASVVLNPCYTNDFKDVDVSGAMAGIVAGIDDHDNTNYYGYAGNEWYPLTFATVVEPGNATTFSIVLNYRDTPKTACFMIKENDEEKWHGPYNMSGDTTSLVDIKAWGSGSISSVTGEYEVAEAQFDGKKYGSVADAMKAAAEAASPGDTPNYDGIAVVDETGEAEAPTVAENGLMPWQNKAMGIEPDAQVGLTKASTKQNAGNITLAAVLPKEEAGVEVKFNVYQDGVWFAGPFAEDDIQIPMTSGSHTYTIEPVVQRK